MKILHVLPSLSYDWGGPSRYVAALAEAQVTKGLGISVYSISDKSATNREIKGAQVKLFPKDRLAKFWTSHSPSLADALRKEVEDIDLIHIHELWHYPHYAAYKAAKYATKPFIVSIHGELDPWCLNHKPIRKKIYSTLIQRKIFREADGVHAMTEKGLRNILNYANSNNAFLVPNGLVKEEFSSLPEKTHLENLYPELKNKKVLLFLGRITPKKGLDILVKAFSTLRKDNDNLHLLVCGPADSEYKQMIVKLLDDNNAAENTTFTGTITGYEKLAAYSRSDIFILPSYSEGFSASALEAMACGLPVIITEHCHFLDLNKAGAGKIIKADAGHLIIALRELLGNPDLCMELGAKAKQIFYERYTMDIIADQMIAVYHEILSRRN